MPILFTHEILILIAFFAAYAFRPEYLYYGDSCTNFLILNSLSKFGTLDLHPVRALCKGMAGGMFSLGSAGQWYSVHEIAWPILTTPYYMLLGNFGVFLFNVFGVLIILRCVFNIACTISSKTAAKIATAIVGMSPPVVFAATTFGSDWPGVLILAITLNQLIKVNYLLGGLSFGLIFLFRIHGVLILPALLIFIFLSTKKFSEAKKLLLYFLLGMLPGVLIFFLQNYLLFNDPFIISYQRRLEDEYNPLSMITHSSLLEIPSLERFYKLISSPETGLVFQQIYFLPVWICGILAMCNKGLYNYVALLLTGIATYTIFYSCYPSLENPVRYFNLFIVLTAILLAVMLDRIYARISSK